MQSLDAIGYFIFAPALATLLYKCRVMHFRAETVLENKTLCPFVMLKILNRLQSIL